GAARARRAAPPPAPAAGDPAGEGARGPAGGAPRGLGARGPRGGGGPAVRHEPGRAARLGGGHGRGPGPAVPRAVLHPAAGPCRAARRGSGAAVGALARATVRGAGAARAAAVPARPPTRADAATPPAPGP